MNIHECQSNLPVLIIYDLHPGWPSEEVNDRLALVQQLRNALQEKGHPVEQTPVHSSNLADALSRFSPNDHIVLNLCEELPNIPHSEDHAPRFLEEAGFTFTGSSARVISQSYLKGRTKKLLESADILVPYWQEFESTSGVEWSIFPAIVKPAMEHCSNGIMRESVVQNRAELLHQIRFILENYSEPALVEEFIDGREFHVGVIGNGKLHMLPPGEIDYSSFPDIHDRLCTYESNFVKNSLAYKLTAPKVPVNLNPKELMQLQKTVIAAYRLCNCRDYARMDVRYLNNLFYVIDVNPNPDISPETSLVLGAGLIGLTYGGMLSLIINLAARRHDSLGTAG